MTLKAATPIHHRLTLWIAIAGCAADVGCSASGSSGNGGNVAGASGAFGQPLPTASGGGGTGTGAIPAQSNGAGGANPIAGAGSAGFGAPPPASAAGSAGAPIVSPGAGGLPIMPPGAGGSPATMPTGTTAPPMVGMCPAPPVGTPDKAVEAWTVLNTTRLAAGAGCMNVVAALDTSALAHCNYDAANASNSTCTADPHGEVMSCTGFTGATAQAREIAAGYPAALAYTEVATTYGNNPTQAVPGWIDTVWHRIPMLDPWTTDMGYGGAARCDVIDIGRGKSSVPTDAVVVYPYNGQTDVPPTFSGLEGPAPPAPPSGWPSSYPINIYAQHIAVTEHVLTKDGDSTPIDHLWLDAQSSLVSSGLKGYFTDTAFLYGAPFELNTKYHVKIAGTHTGGALNVEWTFTTGSKRPFGT